ncbi:hypothetical protein QE152_g38390 [Popillia japonica]|uniref:MGAT4 conserved region domain-containing protein n=1 Tax=Popillia japonica TaxID=7064 RepID=A0AAW1HWN8_POPJA
MQKARVRSRTKLEAPGEEIINKAKDLPCIEEFWKEFLNFRRTYDNLIINMFMLDVSTAVTGNCTQEMKDVALYRCRNSYSYVTSEQMLLQRLAELQAKLQYIDSMYRAKQEDLQQLSHRIDQILIPVDNGTSYNALAPSVKPEVKLMLRNMSGMNAANGINPPYMLRLPSSYHFLPHLLDDPTSLRLNYMMSKGRTGVSIVLGIPTVHREKQNYLMDTLTSLIDGMTPEESEDVVMVIFVAETELEYVLQIAKEVEMRFSAHVDSGLIEVVSPSPAYYPDMGKLRITLGDSMERVRWRSKQNLDFAFLMSYCQPKGTFYVQLEDDILAKPDYISEMKKFAIDKIASKEPWFVLDFCQLGFIGKMFKSAELPWLIQFFQMFYNDKPVDWLLGDLIYTKVCNGDKNYEHCKKERAERWIHYRPSLFQHIGTHSSLKGKVQKLKVFPRSNFFSSRIKTFSFFLIRP